MPRIVLALSAVDSLLITALLLSMGQCIYFQEWSALIGFGVALLLSLRHAVFLGGFCVEVESEE